jgi:hypothetical protein
MDPDWGRTTGIRRQRVFCAAWRYSGREVLHIEPEPAGFQVSPVAPALGIFKVENVADYSPARTVNDGRLFHGAPQRHAIFWQANQ